MWWSGTRETAFVPLSAEKTIEFAVQTEQLGTGHAVASAKEAFEGFSGTVVILSGDVPLLSPQTLADFLAAHRQLGTPLSVLTVELPDPGMYGRVIRDEDGYLLRIVEARDAGPEELAVPEINSGIYAVESEFLFQAVAELGTDNDQKEYYLTDIVSSARNQGLLVAAVMCPDSEEVLGINDRSELAFAVSYLKVRTNHTWMLAGVTMIDPVSNYIETTAKLGRDVTLWPNVNITGKTVIESGATIGPDCLLSDAHIGTGAMVGKGSVIKGVSVSENAVVPPLSVLTGKQ